MKRLLFIVNPKAGKTAIRNDLFDIIMIFSKAGYEVVMHLTTDPGDAERTVIAEGGNYDMVVCAGGDGTLENTVCGYMKMGDVKTPLGYIPVGTTNDMARSLNISRKPYVAAHQIVEGKLKHIDVGQFEDKYFVYIAAFGVFTDISYSTDQSLKKVMGHSAYILQAIKNITNFKSYYIEAQLDDSLITGEYIFGMITNSFSVAGFKIRGTKNVMLDDGKFDCLFIRKPQNVSEFQKTISSILTNNIYDLDENELFFTAKASKVTIKSSEPMAWTLDGEYGGDKESVTILNHQQKIGIYLNNDYELYNEDGDETAVAEEYINEIESVADVLSDLEEKTE